MSLNYIRGFEKQSKVKMRPGILANVGSILGVASGGSIGAGVGMMGRARFQDYLQDQRDRTFKDELIAKAPAILGLGGAIAGGLATRRQFHRKYEKPLQKMTGPDGPVTKIVDAISEMSEMFKEAALKKNVVLRDHQERALAKADENDGDLLVAHATGSGKTLTGIAAFERRKEKEKGKKAIVVVPAGLRENFAENGVKKFTNSSVVLYGPKGEKKSKNIGDKSKADYNVVSYELFREHGEKLLKDTGADTLIMDEIHRVRGTEGSTYNKIKELRPKFKNAITLTGSIVNNNPNDVVPLLDITYKPTGHKLISKKFFDKLFVRPEAKTYGILNPKVHVEKKLKNKEQLGKYISNKVDFISHKDLEKDLPNKITETVEVEMSPDQQKLYDFTMTNVDPMTRWKIKNNIPVGSREAKDAFSKLLQARQVATDPSVLDKELAKKNPMEYSNKIRKIVTDAKKHLGDDKGNRTVIYSNLIKGQLEGVEKALKAEGVDYTKFVGKGQPGVTGTSRTQAIKDFNANKKRVLLLSGAGAEGLDLKNATMMQMVEGHYNPERIQQAEARVRRMGAFAHLPEEKRKVLIKRYISKPIPSASSKLFAGVGLKTGDQGVDQWIYNIANKKDDLNTEFRDVLKKKAGLFGSDKFKQHFWPEYAGSVGEALGQIPGGWLGKAVAKRTDAKVDEKIKQQLLNRQKEQFLQKKHYSKILAESKIDEKAIDASMGVGLVASGLGSASMAFPETKEKIVEQGDKLLRRLGKDSDSSILAKLDDRLGKKMPETLRKVLGERSAGRVARKAVVGVGVGLATVPLIEKVRQSAITGSIKADSPELDEGIKRYENKLRKRLERKYKSSKAFIDEMDVKRELGIDIVS